MPLSQTDGWMKDWEKRRLMGGIVWSLLIRQLKSVNNMCTNK